VISLELSGPLRAFFAGNMDSISAVLSFPWNTPPLHEK
jgi:hypothetical protein